MTDEVLAAAREAAATVLSNPIIEDVVAVVDAASLDAVQGAQA